MHNNLSDISELLKEFDGLVSILNNIDDSLSKMNETCRNLSTSLTSINSIGLNTFLSQASSIVGVVASWEFFLSALIKVPTLAGLATTATTLLTSAINFLTGPVGIVVAAIGLLGGVFLYLSNTQSEAEKNTEAFVESETKKEKR